jgi:hypothetical protein
MLENDQGPESRPETDEPFQRQRRQREPRVSHHYPSLRPNGWYKVIGLNAEALEPRARPGCPWI